MTKDSVGDKEKVVCLELLGQHLTALSQPWWGEETCLNDFCIYLLSITDFPAGRQGASQAAVVPPFSTDLLKHKRAFLLCLLILLMLVAMLLVRLFTCQTKIN